MFDPLTDKETWFRARRYGWGAGMPVKAQGWAVMAAYVATIAGIGWLSKSPYGTARAGAFALFLIVTGMFVRILHSRTEGGLKWRWGK